MPRSFLLNNPLKYVDPSGNEEKTLVVYDYNRFQVYSKSLGINNLPLIANARDSTQIVSFKQLIRDASSSHSTTSGRLTTIHLDIPEGTSSIPLSGDLVNAVAGDLNELRSIILRNAPIKNFLF